MSPPVREGLWAPSGSQASEGLISALAPLTWPHVATAYAVNRIGTTRHMQGAQYRANAFLPIQFVGRLADMISHRRSTSPQRLRWTQRAVTGRLMLSLGIEGRSKQHDKNRQPGPCHEGDNGA